MFTEDVEVEGVNVVVEGLVVKEQLRDKAEVLTVSLLILCVHLKH